MENKNEDISGKYRSAFFKNTDGSFRALIISFLRAAATGKH